MIIILGRENDNPRVITGVTNYHGYPGSTHFGWFRGKGDFGIGFRLSWIVKRYTHIFVMDPTRTKPGRLVRIV